MKAFCWKSGLIEIGRKTPEGAILIHTAPARPLRAAVEAWARHGYGASAGKMLVPGVPESEMFGTDPVQAVIDFAKRVQRHCDRAASKA